MSNDPIHTFWYGNGTMYGCNECRYAGDSPDDIDHDESCSQFSPEEGTEKHLLQSLHDPQSQFDPNEVCRVEKIAAHFIITTKSPYKVSGARLEQLRDAGYEIVSVVHNGVAVKYTNES